MKVMVIGSGGREHVISWALAKSSKVKEVICVPGNGGTGVEEKCRNIVPSLCEYLKDVKEEDSYCEIAKHEGCDLVVVGPEDPLALGVSDTLWKNNIPVVGPKKEAANLEASKDFAKEFMVQYGVACAESKTFTDALEAKDYIKEKGAPIVVKADGLAAGKGVVVAATTEDAIKAVDDFMVSKNLGNAGTKIVIEEYLQGTEISILSAVSVSADTIQNGTACILPFVPARDHKRLLDGAKGPNTGGMGAIAPLDDVNKKQLDEFQKNILEPTLKGLIDRKMDYRGFIFFGIMLTSKGPKLLEYNVRLGDPETQAVLPLMDFDFSDLCKSIIDGTLNTFEPKWKKGYVCAPVVVSGGYPLKYKRGVPISLPKDTKNEVKIFIAGASVDRRGQYNGLITSGGRVLAVSAFGSSAKKAREAAYDVVSQVSFDGAFYRKDIGLPGAAESGQL